MRVCTKDTSSLSNKKAVFSSHEVFFVIIIIIIVVAVAAAAADDDDDDVSSRDWNNILLVAELIVLSAKLAGRESSRIFNQTSLCSSESET